MAFDKTQNEINHRVEKFFGDRVDTTGFQQIDDEERKSYRFEQYNEDFEKEFDWNLYEYIVGHEND